MIDEYSHPNSRDNAQPGRRAANRRGSQTRSSASDGAAQPSGNGAAHRPMRARVDQGSAGKTISPAFVLGVVRQWWKVAAPLGLLLAAVGAFAVWWLFEPVYAAQAWLRIEDNRPYIAFPTRDNAQQFVNTQVALIRSPLVIGPALSTTAMAQIPAFAEMVDPIAALSQQIQVSSVGDSELFVVSYQNRNPQHAATVVNAVVDSYLVLRNSHESSRAQVIIDLLEEEKKRRELEVSRLRDRVQRMTKDATGTDPYAAVPDPQVLRDPLSGLQLQLSDAEVKRTIAEVQVQALEKSLASLQLEIPDVLVEEAVNDHPDVRQVQAAIDTKILTLSQYEVALVGGKDHARHVELAGKLEEDKARLERTRESVAQRMRVDMRTHWYNQREAELAALRAQVEDYKLLQETLGKICDENLASRQESSSISLDLEFARIELARAQEIHNRISDRIDTMRTEQRAPERVDLQQVAEAPRSPVEVLPIKKIGLLSMALFGLPFGLALGWELLVRRVNDAQVLEQELKLPVIAEIARLPVRRNRLYSLRNNNMQHAMEVFEESIDGLRTNLILAESLEDLKVILVTSAVSSEGKTSVAVQLAVSLARASGKRTLLVDADMRAPDIHALLDLSLEPGLGDLLTGECSLDEAVQPEFSDSIHVLTAGRIRATPHRLVGNGRLGATFDEFREKYDYVVVDSPPVLAVSEALVLARHADASLICAMRDSSRVDHVRRAYDRLVGAGTRPVGVVLNGVPIDTYTRRYGTYAYVRS